jgi:nucleoside-diphosphate-sugar epimerase
MTDRMHGAAMELLLEDELSRPDDATISALHSLDGDIVVLGAGGKMGPTLARMAARATASRGSAVYAVSRFRDGAARASLEAAGVRCITADLSDRAAVDALPAVPNVLYLSGQKFGAQQDVPGTWRQNAVVPAYVATRFAAVRDVRIVVFSTGNVYGLTALGAPASHEDDAAAPVGEYAQSCVARERIFSAVADGTGARVLHFRLFYACDCRYGVVTEIAERVLCGEVIDDSMPEVNVIWQGDANRLALRALTLAANPPLPLNVSGPLIAVRDIAEACARAAGKAVRWRATSRENTTALRADVSRLGTLLPHTPLPLDAVCERTVRWLQTGGRTLNKPTKFAVRDGGF